MHVFARTRCVVYMLVTLQWTSASLPLSEMAALQRFYDSTNGDYWNWQPEEYGQKWTFDNNSDPCSDSGLAWQGLTCSSSPQTCATQDCSIVGIQLTSYHLTGPLVSEMWLLSHLTSLVLVDNFITHTIPETLGNISALTTIILSSNLLSGSIPTSILCGPVVILHLLMNHLTGSLPNCLYTPSPSPTLRVLEVAFNHLYGTIPVNNAATFERLQLFDISFNQFDGHIPPYIWTMSSLTHLDLSVNSLSGSLPSDVSQLSRVVKLYLEVNFLTQTIPTSISLWSDLIMCYLGSNKFTGPFPAVSKWTKLLDLDLHNNALTGPIPPNVDAMTSLTLLYLYGNKLTGSIPSSIGLTNLNDIALGGNYLTSSIPEEFCQLSSLTRSIRLSDNLLTGSMPSCFGDFHLLSGLLISDNYISGSLPSTLSGQVDMKDFQLCSNLLTGSIPSGLAANSNIYHMDLSDNKISGTIPNDIFHMPRLETLALFDNHISGSIPTDVGQCASLNALYLNNNRLTGKLPEELGLVSKLQILLLNDNFFLGNPGSVLNRSKAHYFVTLQFLDLSANRFSGTLPAEIFLLPKLVYVAVVNNCFEGNLPDNICTSSPTLIAMLLEGLQSGNMCRGSMWNPFDIFASSTYLAGSRVTGSIPSCLWQMTQLQVLHLGGNGLSGSIPRSFNLTHLYDLSLSYNRLTGTIPHALLRTPLLKLDLKSNRFSGSIDYGYAFNGTNKGANVNTDDDIFVRVDPLEDDEDEAEVMPEDIYYDLKLSENRLSGDIPRGFHRIIHVDILSGNIFDCDGSTDVPLNDPSRSTYVCGSRNLDASIVFFLIFLGLFVVIVLLCVFIMYKYPDFTVLSQHTCGYGVSVAVETIAVVKAWYLAAETVTDASNQELYRFLFTLRALRTLTLELVATISVMYSTFYYLGKSRFDSGTHEYQYRWMFTGAYTSGEMVSIWLACFLLVLLTYFSFTICHINHKCCPSNSSTRQPIAVNVSASGGTRWYSATKMFARQYCFIIMPIVGNAVVVSVVKGMYVYLLLASSTSPAIKLALQMTLAAFDICWNSIVVSEIVDLLRVTLPSPDRVRLRVVILLFNSIVAPLISVAVSDRNCFAELFTGLEEISTAGEFEYCTSWSGDVCESTRYIDLSTSFYPPFTYQYQCASALLKNFIPVFLYSYTLVAFVLPFGYCFKLQFLSRFSVPRPSIIMSDMLHIIVVLLTFGLAAPIVAVAIGCVSFTSSLRHLTSVGHYITQVKAPQYHDTISSGAGVLNILQDRIVDQNKVEEKDSVDKTEKTNLLQTACDDVWRAPLLSLSTIISASCLFYVCMSFDIMGDVYGWNVSVLAVGVSGLTVAMLTLLAVPAALKWYVDCRKTVCDVALFVEGDRSL